MGHELKNQLSSNNQYYTVENLLEIDWSKDFEFVNPINKNRIKTMTDALEVSRVLMNVLDKRTKNLDLCIISTENIIAGIILYVVRSRVIIQNNLAIVTAICCNYKEEHILELLEVLDETKMLGRSMRNSPTLFTEACEMMRQLMIRIYTKEYVRVFVNDSYNAKYSNDENSDYLYEKLPLTVLGWFKNKM